MPAFLEKLRRATTSGLVRHGVEMAFRNHAKLLDLERQLDLVRRALGRIEDRQIRALPADAPLADREYQVYSQWGEDGLLAFLCREARFDEKMFVEFGVENYREANTRFLLTRDGWAGLVLDGDAERIGQVKSDPIYWNHNLKAEAAFLTAETINDIIAKCGVRGRIGVLSIDVDGMDYWLWRALDVVDPAIVVIEYNSLFGPDASVTVPYDPAFDRRRAHPSIVYYGASLRGLARLAAARGYDFVGCGSHGLNAFFVRRDAVAGAIRATTVEQGFVAGGFCEAHDESGGRVKMTLDEERALVASLPTVEIGEDGEPEASA